MPHIVRNSWITAWRVYSWNLRWLQASHTVCVWLILCARGFPGIMRMRSTWDEPCVISHLCFPSHFWLTSGPSHSHFCFCFTFWKQEGLAHPELRKHPFFVFFPISQTCAVCFLAVITPSLTTDSISCFSSRLVCGLLWWWGMALWSQSAPGGVTDKLLPYQLS